MVSLEQHLIRARFQLYSFITCEVSSSSAVILISGFYEIRSKKFSYKDVKRATDGFHRIVYSNSHGAAYKARFEGGEVALFSTGNKRLLVFDDIENGSLKEHFNDPLKTPLNWKTRLQIAVGVAAALEYLLLFSNPPVYHVSINSSNIMLYENFTAMLTDVGLLSSIGTYVQMPHSSCSEECMGQKCGNIIFQLGVLILELITGQSSELITGQSSEQGGTDLIQWVQGSRLSSSIDMMIDPDLGNNYDSKELKKLLVVPRLCLKSKNNPEFPVPQVFRFLQKKVQIPRD
ncbi:probable receptor-like protein kinase At1g49730 [Hibiscus syriacus]|uniref:probable receptor-like protein kinase At1g49730 n=1 Tax=Hibiscus syriacus TaxID=106335 RepID=UPI0019248B69|nr:probable receptor-like protein kinase At1g49730 [Hibiscus syriacus]